jgi:peptidoglycan/LPS O-acetylase OafA/YrhL
MLILIGDYLQGTTYSVAEIFELLVVGGAAAPYYYVPLLIQLYILSPFIVPLARNRWQPLLFITAIVSLIVVSLRYGDTLGVEVSTFRQMMWITKSWFFPAHLFWFAFGIVAGFHLQQLKNWAARIKWGLLAAVGITFLAGMLEWEILRDVSRSEWLAPQETVIDNLYAGAFILSFLILDMVSIPFSKRLGELGSKSFGVYLVHDPVLEYTSKFVYHITPWLLAYQILFQPLLIVLGLGIPLLLMAVVKRSPARGLYVYLFG